FLDARDNRRVLLDREANDIHDLPRVEKIRREPRQLFATHRIETRIRQADGVDHTALELRDARRRSAVSRLGGDCLRDDAAQATGGHHTSELATVARRAGGENDGILKDERADDRAKRSVSRHRDGPLPAPAVPFTRLSYRSRYCMAASAMAA